MEQMNDTVPIFQKMARVMLLALALGILALMFILLQSPIGAIWRNLFDALFGFSSTHAAWFVTRASGIIAYFLLWLSTIWGLGVSTKFFDRAVPRTFTYDAHEYISLLALGFTVVHIVILLFDTFTPFNLPEIVFPFISSYRPVWTGIGIVGWYLVLLVTVTFYLRKWIGLASFRAIHLASFAAYAGVTLHGWFAGTDTNFALMRWLYLGSALVVVIMTVMWLALRKKGAPNALIKAQEAQIEATEPGIAQDLQSSYFGAQTVPLDEYRRKYDPRQ